MAESFNSKRLVFPKGKQKLFIENALAKSGLTQTKLADLIKISPRTLADWKREKFTMQEESAKKLSEKLELKIPDCVEIRASFWSVKKAAKLGAKATIKKYGAICTDPEKRKAGWKKWWQSKGKYSFKHHNQPKQFSKPKKSVELSEFVGIMLGDGGITDYQISITLNKRDDKDYIEFVAKMLEKLFRVKTGRTVRESVVVLTLSRINLVNFCQKMGLVKGNKIKQQIDIPNWIKRTNRYSVACVRGLVDTDGGVFNHRYRSNGKEYCYRKLAFSSRSKPLIHSVGEILKQNLIKCRVDSKGDIRLDDVGEVRKYFKTIGSHNPKHLNKIIGWKSARVG